MQTRFPRIRANIDICREPVLESQQKALIDGMAAYASLSGGINEKSAAN